MTNGEIVFSSLTLLLAMYMYIHVHVHEHVSAWRDFAAIMPSVHVHLTPVYIRTPLSVCVCACVSRMLLDACRVVHIHIHDIYMH